MTAYWIDHNEGDADMANLSIRKLDDEIVRLLRIRAAQHGVSMEEEARQILKRAVKGPEHLGTYAVNLFRPAYEFDEPGEFELPEREFSQPPKFE